MLIGSGRPAEIEDLLARARALTPDQIHALAAGDRDLRFQLPERFSDEVADRVAGPWRRVACG